MLCPMCKGVGILPSGRTPNIPKAHCSRCDKILPETVDFEIPLDRGLLSSFRTMPSPRKGWMIVPAGNSLFLFCPDCYKE